jgi:UDPglucose--hexose-1-phosphate uridylyltransferase
MIWDKDLFIEKKEEHEVIIPLAGPPEGMQRFIHDDIFKQPVIRRKNYQTNEWTHINIARASRPLAPKTGFKIEEKECMFCPQNVGKTPRHRKTGTDYILMGEKNDWKLRVFPNLYPWLVEHLNIVQTPKHKISLKESNPEEEFLALKTAKEIVIELEKNKTYPVIFRNHGWGASITHFHWQIGSLPYIPTKINEEVKLAKKFYEEYKTNLFQAIIESEKEKNERVILESENNFILSPFAPRTNFEILIICKKDFVSLSMCDESYLLSLADDLHDILQRLYSKAKVDILNVVIHQLPAFEKSSHCYRLHIELLPFKFLAGAERGFSEFAVEVTPEKAASILKA